MPAGIQILTPEGKLAQYYMGVEYSPKDLQLGLVEASHNKIGSPVDNILTYCYRYDPELNKHSLVVARIVQLGGSSPCSAWAALWWSVSGATSSGTGWPAAIGGLRRRSKGADKRERCILLVRYSGSFW